MLFKRIRDLREDADKTQIEIANYLYLNRNVYWRYDARKQEVPVWVVLRLAELYGVTTDYLLGLSNQRR